LATDNKKFIVKNGLAVGNGATGPIDVITNEGVWVGATGTLQGATGLTGATGPAGIAGATGPSGEGGSGGEDPVAMALVFGGGGGDDAPSGLTAGETDSGYLIYSGTSKVSGQLYGGTTDPTNTTRLNYDGNLHVNEATAVNFNSISDIKYKENIQKIDNAMELIYNINPVSFHWKSNGKKSYGVIAQEIEKVLPDIVHTSNDTKTVAYDELIAIIMQALKDQQKIINKLLKDNEES